MRDVDTTEVLVVGAGPVGMVTALLLAEAGIDVQVIDKEEGPTARSYACALHPRSLALLSKLGLMEGILESGHRIESIAFYEGDWRHAEVQFTRLPSDFPCVLAMPQSDLERLLERQLQLKRVPVLWSHRLGELKTEESSVVAAIDKLGVSSKGYIAPDLEWEVIRTDRIKASFVVGADGQHSHVRQHLGVNFDHASPPETYVVFEFETGRPLSDEIRVVLTPTTSSVLWPLGGPRARWSFQLPRSGEEGEFPSKERESVIVDEPPAESDARHRLDWFLHLRAPWFTETIKEIKWNAEIHFQHRLARRFGEGRCWLAGDAAHQTGPVGVQSLNAGLCEAEALAGILKRILREKASLDSLEAYNRDRRAEWQTLLGMSGELSPKSATSTWVKDRRKGILPCLPATGPELTLLLEQLGLEMAPAVTA